MTSWRTCFPHWLIGKECSKDRERPNMPKLSYILRWLTLLKICPEHRTHWTCWWPQIEWRRGRCESNGQTSWGAHKAGANKCLGQILHLHPSTSWGIHPLSQLLGPGDLSESPICFYERPWLSDHPLVDAPWGHSLMLWTLTEQSKLCPSLGPDVSKSWYAGRPSESGGSLRNRETPKPEPYPTLKIRTSTGPGSHPHNHLSDSPELWSGARCSGDHHRLQQLRRRHLTGTLCFQHSQITCSQNT